MRLLESRTVGHRQEGNCRQFQVGNFIPQAGLQFLPVEPAALNDRLAAGLHPASENQPLPEPEGLADPFDGWRCLNELAKAVLLHCRPLGDVLIRGAAALQVIALATVVPSVKVIGIEDAGVLRQLLLPLRITLGLTGTIRCHKLAALLRRRLVGGLRRRSCRLLGFFLNWQAASRWHPRVV